MKRPSTGFYASLLILFILVTSPAQADTQALRAFLSMPLEKNELAFMRLGPYSNVVVRVGEKTVLFDPANLKDKELSALNEGRVDLVLYTHGHYDHLDISTALRLFEGSQPVIAVEPSLAKNFKDAVPDDKLIIASPGQSFSAGTITIDAIEGKHIGPITLFNVSIDGIEIFHGGYSAYVPLEKTASHIAFVPTGSPSPTCRPEYAYQMIRDIKPQFAVPMHGSDGEHKNFEMLTNEKMPDVKIINPKPYTALKIHIKR